MYVCICNGINERRVDDALAQGAATVGQIYRASGCAPRCGKCVPVMREKLAAARGCDADTEVLCAG